MRRPKHRTKERLLRMLRALAKSQETCDRKMLRELQKCPDSSKATAILADALGPANHVAGSGRYLCPDASWIHPLV
jgi:hypothetical protein